MLPKKETNHTVFFRRSPMKELVTGSVTVDSFSESGLQERLTEAVKKKYGKDADLVASTEKEIV
jgi:hypothetical protein